MINFLPGIQSTASALTAERVRMDVVSQNIANADSPGYKPKDLKPLNPANLK